MEPIRLYCGSDQREAIGLPAFSEYAECDYATEWRRELNKAMNIQGAT